ncbi:angiogenin-like isoform X2 [Emydura macquarii macquarii]
MALQGSPLLLLLLTAALVVLGASASQEQYERFRLQHIDPKPKGRDDAYCNRRMRWMMTNDKRMTGGKEKVCKETNTFIHVNSDRITEVCTPEKGKDYRTKTGQLMRQSTDSFQVTNCKHHGGKPILNCEYRASKDSRKIIIACDEARRPVHLDDILI